MVAIVLTNLKIENIKCFGLVEFNFSNLTVFCGANSVGKSTAIQCLLLLKQSYDDHQFKKDDLNLMGKYFSVGHASDLINHNASGEKVLIQLDDCEFSSDLKSLSLDEYSIKLQKKQPTHKIFTNAFHYLSAYRLAPQNSYDVNYDNSALNFGIYGEFAIAELARHGAKPAINKKLAETIWKGKEKDKLVPAGTNITLDISLTEAMKNIFPDFNINVERYDRFDKVANTYSSSGTSNSVRPVNTGFGVSYVLPIVIAALSTAKGGVLIVENPEVHLHPEAQSNLARFLSLASQCDIQVILETHSDHIINGVRVFAKENEVSSDHVIVNSIRNISGMRRIKEILIDSNGDLSDVDKGFLDQAERDLMRLF